MKEFLKRFLKRIAIIKKAWYNRFVMEMQNINELYEKVILGEKREDFERFRALLLEYNQRYNLTTT